MSEFEGRRNDDSEVETAESLKIKGNDYFVQKEYGKAEAVYTQALEMESDMKAMLFTNRSAARFSLGKYQESLEDSERALECDKTWIKAYYRKAAALGMLGNMKGKIRS
jgi:serine/threonine-protein phosphatase 5